MKKIALAFLVAALGFTSGCTFFKALPTSVTDQAAAQAAVAIAVGAAVQQGSTDPAVWKARATQFENAAKALQAVAANGPTSLATLQADLMPFIAALGPADVLAANALVAALTPLLVQLIGQNQTVAAVQTDINLLLNDVIASCRVYTGV